MIPRKAALAAVAVAATAVVGSVEFGAAPIRVTGDLDARQEDAPKSYVLKAGTLYTGDGAAQKNMAVVVREGRIEFVRSMDAELPQDLPVIDRSDATIVPGFVMAESGIADAFEERFRGTQIGTIVVFRNVDPLRKALDGFNFVERRDSLLASGVTAAYLSPGRARLVNGRGAIVKIAGASVKDRSVREIGDLSLGLGVAVEDPPNYFEPPLPPSAENPIIPGKPQFPKTRSGAAFALRKAFEDAIAHAKLTREASDPARRPPFSSEKVELAELLRSKVPVRVRVDSDADARAALTLLREYGLTGTLVGAAEADAVAKELKEAGIAAIVEIPVITGAPRDRSARVERPRDPALTAAALAAAGVRVALAPAEDAQIVNTPLLLVAAVRGGMSREAAVRAVTSDAARILNIAERTGSLTPGRDADFVVLNGEPGDVNTSVSETWSSGVRVFDRAAADRARREVKRLVENRGSVVVRAGLVIPVSGDPITNGAVAIHDGKIIGVGRNVPVPRGASVIDAGPNAVITPGLIDGRSYLGLDGDGSPVNMNLPVQFLAAPRNPDFQLAAEGGVTTVLLQSAIYPSAGSPVAALKTGGSWRDAVVREACGIGIPTQSYNLDAYRQLLKRGKDYTDRWDKYFAEVDKQKEDAKKAATESRKADEKPADVKKDEKKEGEAEKPVVDPLTGIWEGDLRGGPMPRPEAFTLRLRLKGEAVSGSFSTKSPLARGQDAEFDNGTFKDNTFSVTLTRPEIPFPLKLEAKIDKPDHMTGTVNAQVITLDFEATRTEKAVPTIAPKSVKKKGPEMPPIDDGLEPYRRLFKGDAALVVRADSKSDIENAIQVVVDEFKLPLVILGGMEADLVAPLMAAKKVGLLTGPNLTMARDSGLPMVTELAAAGVPVAFGTESGTGAVQIASVGASIVARSVGADTVLRGFTLDTAKMFRIDSRVGSLDPGKDGDLVVWDGAPFSGRATVRTVVVGGEVVKSDSSNAEAK